ncbi:MAG: class I SAM-dependent methyltransferase [Candidatus Methanofastidiosa archaeon]|jgi:ubiquinone/menaquinone biosynthesis C-methylase UbiE|nr:class I SAM-dependent methyltransferase [Candidatus Methanofastidiosa archaeon]HOM95297.1 class I SAM-dependent methyltransferase [Methanofastidiosum sp.]HPC80634.1 class I SAM-dependent methyltransferase [Methanofastidiosum sp.]HRS25116.1 class I SAM-dependent methyltransferase [Methanofastidiosum sp.]
MTFNRGTLSNYIDWNSIWNKTINFSFPENENERNYYNDKRRAEAYDNSKLIKEDGEKRAKELNFDKNYSVLDIGAGPGVLAVPLARYVKKVTVVEPSQSMIDLLKKHIVEERLTNIEIFQSKWENFDTAKIEKHDIVIASYSLLMQNIKESLLKMEDCSNKEVILYWFSGVTSWEKLYMDLYQKIYGSNYTPSPKCNVIYNVLYDMGRSPNITVLKGTSFPKIYDSIDQAISDLKLRLRISDSKNDKYLAEYIETKFNKSNGKYIWDDDTVYVQIKWQHVE